MIYFILNVDTCIVNNITHVQTNVYDRPTVGQSSADWRPISGVCLPTVFFYKMSSTDRLAIVDRLTLDDRATFGRYHDEKIFKKSTDCRATIARRFTDDKTPENRRTGQRNFKLGCFDKKVAGLQNNLPKSVPTSGDNRATVGLGIVTVV